MTLSETKALIRAARTLMRDLRARVNDSGGQLQAITLPRPEFETLEWGMGHLLKAWIYDHDENGDRIPDTDRLVRINSLYALNDGTDNFLFKGIPVRWQEQTR